MKNITIDSSTIWKSLPWAQIKEKIFIVQQKLYESSKECNQKEVKKLQNYILNSNDSKIFAIQTIVDYISKYYIKYSKEKYNFNDKDKFLIYESLFDNNIYSIKIIKIQFIVEQIKQYLVYLCLKPEWEARLEPMYKMNINSQKQYYFLHRLSKYLLKNFTYKSIKIFCLNSKLKSKYVNVQYLISKVQPLQSICHYLQTWLYNNYTLEYLNDNTFTNQWNIQPISNLYNLIYRIIYNGLNWSNIKFFKVNYYSIFIDYKNSIWICDKNSFILLTYLKSVNIFNYALGIENSQLYTSSIYSNQEQFIISDYFINYYKKNKLLSIYSHHNLIINIYKNIYKYFIREIRVILYHQNLFDKWRSNSNLDLIKLLKRVTEKFLCFYSYYYPFIDSVNINSLIILIDNLVLHWTKKYKKMYLTHYKKELSLHLLSSLKSR